MTSEEKDLTIRILLDKQLCSPLLAAESYLEREQYDEAIDKLNDYVGKEKYKTSDVYFMIEYFLGQAIFRKEFAKKLRDNNLARKIKKFRKAILYMEQAISFQPDFTDAKLMLGLACMAMAGLIEREKYIQKAKTLFEDCVQNGSSIQKVYAREKLEFLKL